MADGDEIRKPVDEGYPFILSRNTDVAQWFMDDWLRKVLELGHVLGQDPMTGIPCKWSTSEEDLHSLYFMTKDPGSLADACETWLSDYPVAASITITGWEEVETRAPSAKEQIEGLERLVETIGWNKVKWRYSPIPTDMSRGTERYDQLRRLASLIDVVADVGVRAVETSLMQDSPHWSTGYGADGEKDEGEREKALSRTVRAIRKETGMEVGLCADDLAHSDVLDESDWYRTACIGDEMLTELFDKEGGGDRNDCGCLRCIEPCTGQQFGCPSACEYCYVPETKPPNSDLKEA